MNLPQISQLNTDQVDALYRLKEFCSLPVTKGEFQAIRMSGPPGSGKTTTLVLSMLDIAGPALQDPTSTMPPILITAPMNKAVRQLRQMLDGAGVRFETTTIYKALGMRLMPDGEVRYTSRAADEPAASKFRIVVVDEYSMLNRKVTEELIAVAVRFGIKVIFLGDDDQIPPVKESHSPVSSTVQEFTELTKIERSDANSPVQATVKTVRSKIRDKDYSEIILQSINDKQLGGQYILGAGDWISHFKSQAKACWDTGNLDLSRAIAYTNDRVDFLNDQARKFIHGKKVKRFIVGETLIIASPVFDREENFTVFPTDEEVIITHVNEDATFYDEVANTGEWKVWELCVTEHDGSNPHTLVVLHDSEKSSYKKAASDIKKICYRDRSQWSKVFHPFEEQFHQVKYPYAITAHRSQGSTYHTVFVDAKNMQEYLGKTLSNDLYWRLLYVAISRAKFNVAFNHDAL